MARLTRRLLFDTTKIDPDKFTTPSTSATILQLILALTLTIRTEHIIPLILQLYMRFFIEIFLYLSEVSCLIQLRQIWLH